MAAAGRATSLIDTIARRSSWEDKYRPMLLMYDSDMVQWFRVRKKLTDFLTSDEVQDEMAGITIEVRDEDVLHHCWKKSFGRGVATSLRTGVFASFLSRSIRSAGPSHVRGSEDIFFSPGSAHVCGRRHEDRDLVRRESKTARGGGNGVRTVFGWLVEHHIAQRSVVPPCFFYPTNSTRTAAHDPLLLNFSMESSGTLWGVTR